MNPVAVPSAGRAGQATTPQALAELDIDCTLYVPPQQIEAYKAAHPTANVVTDGGVAGIPQARSHILQQHAGQRMVMMDDDVPSLMGGGIDTTIQEGFDALDRLGLTMWGVYPVANRGWLKPRIAVGQMFLIGQMFGMDVPTNPPTLRAPLKEDYELCAHILDKEGAVVRLEYVAPKSRNTVGAGGCQDYRDQALEHEACQYLLDRWPNRFRPARALQGRAQVAFKRIGAQYLDARRQHG